MPPSCHGRFRKSTVCQAVSQTCTGTPRARIEGSLRTRCTSFSILDSGHRSIAASATSQVILSQTHTRHGTSRAALSMEPKEKPHKA